MRRWEAALRLSSERLRTSFLSFIKASLGRAAEGSPGLMATTGLTAHITSPCPANVAPTPLPSVVLVSHLKKWGF